MAIARVTTEWTGFSGAPGYTVFHFNTDGSQESVAAMVAKTAVFWSAIRSRIPAGITLNIRPEIEIINGLNGQLENYVTVAQPSAIAGAGVATHSAAVGACIGWVTAGVVAGRRVRGRTFIVPLETGAWEANGTLTPTALSAIRDAAVALAAPDQPRLGVYSRPREGSAGVLFEVSGVRVQDKAAVLRSRRD